MLRVLHELYMFCFVFISCGPLVLAGMNCFLILGPDLTEEEGIQFAFFFRGGLLC